MTLARQQALLLDALFAWPAENAMKNVAALAIDSGARGLKAYQTNGHVLAERSLSTVYPVVVEMVGEASFADLARALWHAHPPVCGDLGRWGSALPAFMQASSQLAEFPYLPDVARAEWLMHCSATASDRSPDPQSLALLTQQDPDALCLWLAPGCAVLQSAWPVASILSAHREQNPSFDALAALLHARAAQDLVVWRSGYRPQVRQALPGEVGFLQSLLDGASLGQALAAHESLDFGHWFPAAIQAGIVLGAALQKDIL